MIRPSVVVTVAMLCVSSVLAAQGNADDPWRKVPPLPTSCFHDQWAFDKTLGDVYAQLGEAQAKQQEINDALVLKFGEMDMQVKMQKMMEYMRKDPQKAQKMMEAQANIATGIKNDVMSGDDARKEREAEFAQLTASFNSEMDAGAKPFRTRRDEIMKTSRRVLGEGDNWEFTTKAAETEFNTLIDKENADYEARCAAYFGANGKMHQWLASYRETVIDPVARATEANDETRATLMMIMESPGAGYRSTAQLEAVREYVRVARKPFALRRNKVPNIHDR